MSYNVKFIINSLGSFATIEESHEMNIEQTCRTVEVTITLTVLTFTKRPEKCAFKGQRKEVTFYSES